MGGQGSRSLLDLLRLLGLLGRNGQSLHSLLVELVEAEGGSHIVAGEEELLQLAFGIEAGPALRLLALLEQDHSGQLPGE